MKLITRDTDYAVRALCYISQNKDKVMVTDELVKVLGIPKPFLRKILQILNKNGVLKSFKGVGGGFVLKKDSSDIFLTDLMRIFQGQLKINECIFKKKICPNEKKCSLRNKINSLEDYVIGELRKVSIASLLKK